MWAQNLGLDRICSYNIDEMDGIMEVLALA